MWVPDPRRCTILAPEATPGELNEAFRALRAGVVRCSPADLPARFGEAAASLVGGPTLLPLTARELQCGCAISLGLENRQMAAVLYLSQGTVKNYLSALRGKLSGRSRREIAALFEQALSNPSMPPSG